MRVLWFGRDEIRQILESNLQNKGISYVLMTLAYPIPYQSPLSRAEKSAIQGIMHREALEKVVVHHSKGDRLALELAKLMGERREDIFLVGLAPFDGATKSSLRPHGLNHFYTTNEIAQRLALYEHVRGVTS